MLRYICSLPNPGLKGRPHELFYPDDEAGRAQAEAFIARENGQPGRGIYYCIGKLKDGATARCRDTVCELDEVVVDLDLKNIAEPRDAVIACLQGLLLPPCEIRDSGFGLHVVWRLKEAVADEAGLAEAEDSMKRLVNLLAGDPAPTHRAALLRQPGTVNTKEPRQPGTVNTTEPLPRRCHAMWQGGKECDISEFAEMFDMYGDRPLLTREEKPRGNGHDAPPADDAGPDTRDFRTCEDRFDVDAWFAAMPPTGAGANEFQPKALTALLWEGTTPDDCIERVAAATMARAAGAGLDWTQGEEVREVTRRCVSSVGRLNRKYDAATGVIPAWLAGEFHDTWATALAQGKRPQLTRNAEGWYVRACGATEDDGTKKENDKASAGDKPTGKKFVIRPFVPFDLAALPPRQWLYGRHYQRRTVSATIAPGGFGKTTLCMVETVSMATCRNLLGEQPMERLRAWYHNGEDTLEELQRRLGAICLHYGIPQEELRGWFFMTSGNEVPLRVAAGYSDLKIDKALIELINAEIARNEIDVAVLDPLITLHGVPEQDNSKMDMVIRIFASIADSQDCAVELAHHTRKLPPGANGTDYVAADIRGATATKDAVRAARMLNHMGEKDAEAAGIPEHERTAYFRADRVKGNNSPAAKAVWRRFINVELPNSDEVGVVVAWEFPGQGSPSAEMRKAEHDAETVFMMLLGRLTLEGRVASDRVGPNYAPALFSREDEAKAAKISKAALAAAMRRLFAAKRIRVDSEGTGGHRVHRIVIV